MSGRVSRETISSILDRTDLVELIGGRIALKSQHGTHKACCPFHQEKTPSFHVNGQKQFYYCFGCGVHGNAIDFLMAYEHQTFPEALAQLASQCGIELETVARDDHHEQLVDVLRRVSGRYQKAYQQTASVQAYVARRGLSADIVQRFAIGYAPAGWGFLTDNMKTQAGQQALLATGMVIEKDAGGYYDRFRDRLMFPIRDTRGRVVAFGGRVLGDEQPKYLNSPETVLFHKGQLLYGLYEAMQSTRSLEELIVVEGYMDVVGLAQHGIHTAVATLGTAVSRGHIEKCLKRVKRLVFCFDGDMAGKKAAWKAVEASLPVMRADYSIRVLYLPEGEDPDSWVKARGAPAFLQACAQAQPLSEVFFEQLLQMHDLSSIEGRASCIERAEAYFKGMPPGIFLDLMRETCVKRVGQYQQVKPSSSRSHRVDVTGIKQWTLAHKAAAILLDQPTLVDMISDVSFLSELKLSGVSLLRFLIEQCRRTPGISLAELLAMELNEQQKRLLVGLTQTQVLGVSADWQQEWRDCIQGLEQITYTQRAQGLIEKMRQQGGLSDEERQQLDRWLKKGKKPVK